MVTLVVLLTMVLAVHRYHRGMWALSCGLYVCRPWPVAVS